MGDKLEVERPRKLDIFIHESVITNFLSGLYSSLSKVTLHSLFEFLTWEVSASSEVFSALRLPEADFFTRVMTLEYHVARHFQEHKLFRSEKPALNHNTGEDGW